MSRIRYQLSAFIAFFLYLHAHADPTLPDLPLREEFPKHIGGITTPELWKNYQQYALSKLDFQSRRVLAEVSEMSYFHPLSEGAEVVLRHAFIVDHGPDWQSNELMLIETICPNGRSQSCLLRTRKTFGLDMAELELDLFRSFDPIQIAWNIERNGVTVENLNRQSPETIFNNLEPMGHLVYGNVLVNVITERECPTLIGATKTFLASASKLSPTKNESENKNAAYTEIVVTDVDSQFEISMNSYEVLKGSEPFRNLREDLAACWGTPRTISDWAASIPSH